MGLKTYQAKRTFSQTPEPKALKSSHNKSNSLVFCVQKHAASHLHYDFRLECNGVLLSWAVPKGPSMNPQDKRLAMKVEDHPFEYRNFEGVIPPGNYGAGTVMVWDEGTYTVPGAKTAKEIEKTVSQGIHKGHFEFELQGEKLKGFYSLVKLKKDDSDNSWLLIKKKDDYSMTKDITNLDHSAKTDRTLDEIAEDEGGPPPTKTSTKKTASTKQKDSTPKKKAKLLSCKPMPRGIKPMLAKLMDAPFDNEDWLFETKWDGYRALAYIEKGKVDLLSRNENSFNEIFKPIVEELERVEDDVILDGEVVILDNDARSNFQLMQNYQRAPQGNLFYYVFDILYLNGQDLRDLPLIERKKYLKQFLGSVKFSKIRYSDHVENVGKALFQQASKYNLEGIMGKNKNSPYTSKRSSDWVKIKTHQRQEAVIGGFTAPQGSRTKFGALLLGVYEDNKLKYIGHTGGGFSRQLLDDTYSKLEPLIQKGCPFETTPKPNAPVTWIKPKLVCEISFSEWTSDGKVRQPIFQGLRIDKKPKEVKMELPQVVEPKDASSKKKSKSPQINFTHPEKIYWPNEKYTKEDMLHYYQEVSPFLLPHLKNHPVTLRRYPDGIAGESFYQKDSSSLHLPDWIQTVTIPQESRKVKYILIQDLPTLEYVLNLGAIEIHPFLSQAENLSNPDYMVIDLDPEDIPLDKVVEAAQVTHKLLDSIKVENVCKTSGKRGLHIFIPLQGKYNFEQAKQFGEILAAIINQQIPEFTSLERKPKNRQKKVYIDVYQNNLHQSVIAPYCLRALDGAPVSTPLDWKEVKKGLDPKKFNMKTVPERLKKLKKDLFKPVLGKGADLKAALKRLEKIQNES